MRPQPMAKENESPPVSGRRIESSRSAGLSMLRKAVLKNAPTTPMLPRSSHGVPGPGAMRLNIVCLRESSEAMATLGGGVDLAMASVCSEFAGMSNGLMTQCLMTNDQRMPNDEIRIRHSGFVILWALGI